MSSSEPFDQHSDVDASTPVPDADDVVTRFRSAWTDPEDQTAATPELLPVRLARACASVLSVDGAGLSLVHEDFRLPLGASDEEASLAERLQFTQGQGPCLEAAHDQRIIVADPSALERRWPLFAQELNRRTGFQAVLTVPLRLVHDTRGALDLFFRDPETMGSVSVADASAITDSIVEILAAARKVTTDDTTPGAHNSRPAWLASPAVRDREMVWIAMGMIMARFDVGAPDSLALLRGYAYSHDSVVDETAIDLVRGAISLDGFYGAEMDGPTRSS